MRQQEGGQAWSALSGGGRWIRKEMEKAIKFWFYDVYLNCEDPLKVLSHVCSFIDLSPSVFIGVY